MSQQSSIILQHKGINAATAAAVLRDSALGAPDPEEILLELAGVANDPGLGLRTRAVALHAVAMTAHRAGLPLPNDAVEAVDDFGLIDWAIKNDLVPALTGVLALAAKDSPVLDGTRKLIGRKLLANGYRGSHVTALLVDAGDYEAGARAAAEDFVQNIASDQVSAQLSLAWARITVGWLQGGLERIFVLFCRELRKHDEAAESFAVLLRQVPHAAPEMIAAAVDVLLEREDG